MFFSKIAILSLAASVLAVPTKVHLNQKRALQIQDYADFQISDGVAGNALAEVSEKFPIEEFEADLAGVSEEDLAILKAAREAAEAAEADEGGFNDAIDAVGGKNTEEGQALQVGKIKNKVLKLKLQVVALQIDQAQGKDNQEKIDEEITKLNANIANDEESAGATSQSIDFQATSDPDQ